MRAYGVSFEKLNADIFCLQETKLQEGQIELKLPEEYQQYWNYAEKKGYSGTAVFTRLKPVAVTYGIGIEEHDHEGRVITLEFPDYYFITCYTPNSQDGLRRLEYRMRWEDDFRAYMKKLDAQKPVIVCGDLNVAHEEIDLKNPKTNRKNAGFTDEERGKMTELLNAGFTDTFRYFHPDEEGVSMPERRTQAGASTTSSHRKESIKSCRLQASIPRFSALTTARWNWMRISEISEGLAR